MKIALELVSPGSPPLDLGRLFPSEVLGLPVREIEKLTVSVAGRPEKIGQHFKVSRAPEGPDELVLSGATAQASYAGFRMEAGRLVIDGDAGPFTGAEMAGGELEVRGNAGDSLGAAMRGGRLRARGAAGDWCGAALPGQAQGMTGGTLVVDGEVGVEAGAGMRRGLLIVGGDCGESAGAGLLAGTIFCLGCLGPGAGLEMKRGSLVAGSSGTLLPGFRPAGEADPEWLHIYTAWLRRLGLSIPPRWDREAPRRFTGDHLVLGKGEVLVYDVSE
jgi:formylmethanofuran dehydrogenase subunit C